MAGGVSSEPHTMMAGGVSSVAAVMVVLGMMGTVEAWGRPSTCTIMHQDKEWLSQLSSESARNLTSTVASLEDKLNTVLAMVENFKVEELIPSFVSRSPRSDSGNSGPVERDLSGREEPTAAPTTPTAALTTPTAAPTTPTAAPTTPTAAPTTPSTHTNDESTNPTQESTKPTQETTVVEDLLREVNVVDRREETVTEREDDGDDDDDENGVKKGDCKVLVMNNHDTIGMFFMNTYNHGHCTNRHPIVDPVRYCLGYCATKTFVSRKDGIWSTGNDCNSCQPQRHQNIIIPLACDDGFKFEKSFQNVVSCKCQRCRPMET
ncbi:hypothetical protein Pcinc_005225 [Petrolisthes cinctipes]|uniref:CTCK domain-containing protein n=1 Tax=Petrolisthes cinctipes TaxID=88211 RepID=A0AAE1GFL4_PETCI|nr:hypothetical protein Pcinc_005225 [Petrolisthes cinctipes]